MNALIERNLAARRAGRGADGRAGLRCLRAYSWFYSTALCEVSPRLCRLRDFFAENGATIVETETAPSDYGFMIGGAGRALPAEARLPPRLTLILWSRAHMLAWAARHRETPG